MVPEAGKAMITAVPPGTIDLPGGGESFCNEEWRS